MPPSAHANAVWPVVGGGGLGVAAMLGHRALGERVHGRVGLISLIGVDVFIDGVVLRLAFAAAEKAGLLLTFALTIEALFLALVLSGELGDAMRGAPLFALTAAIVLMRPAGVLASTPLSAASPTFVTGAFAFGLAALLYLVTEELLVCAHDVEDRPWATALFFVGFPLLAALEDAALSPAAAFAPAQARLRRRSLDASAGRRARTRGRSRSGFAWAAGRPHRRDRTTRSPRRGGCRAAPETRHDHPCTATSRRRRTTFRDGPSWPPC